MNPEICIVAIARGGKPVTLISINEQMFERDAAFAMHFATQLSSAASGALMGAFIAKHLTGIGMPDELVEQAVVKFQQTLEEAINATG